MTSRPTLIQQCLIIFPPALNSFPGRSSPGVLMCNQFLVPLRISGRWRLGTGSTRAGL